MKKGTPPVSHMKIGVIQKLKHKKLEHIMEGDYRTAEKYEKALDALQDVDKNSVDEVEERRKSSFEDREKVLQDQKAKINQDKNLA